MKRKSLDTILCEAGQRGEISPRNATAVMAAVDYVSKLTREQAGALGIGAVWPAHLKQLLEIKDEDEN